MVFRFSGYSILTMGLSSILTRLSLTYLGDLRLVASIFAIQLAAVLIWPDPVIRVNGPLTFTFTALRDLDETIRSHGLLVPWVYIEPPSRRPLSSTFNPARFIRSFLGHFSATTESSLLLSPIIKLAPVFQALLYNAFIVEQPSSALGRAYDAVYTYRYCLCLLPCPWPPSTGSSLEPKNWDVRF
jgi:hypothetical protein